MSTSDAEDSDNSEINEIFIPHQNWASDEETEVVSKIRKLEHSKQDNEKAEIRKEIVHFRYAMMGIEIVNISVYCCTMTIEKIESFTSKSQMDIEQLTTSTYSYSLEIEQILIETYSVIMETEEIDVVVVEKKIKVKKKKLSSKQSNKKTKKKEQDEIDRLLDQKIKENEKLNGKMTKPNPLFVKEAAPGKKKKGKKLWEQVKEKRQIEAQNSASTRERALQIAAEHRRENRTRSEIENRTKVEASKEIDQMIAKQKERSHRSKSDSQVINNNNDCSASENLNFDDLYNAYSPLESSDVPDFSSYDIPEYASYDILNSSPLTYFFDESDPKLPPGTIGVKLEDDNYYGDEDSNDVLIEKFKRRAEQRKLEHNKAREASLQKFKVNNVFKRGMSKIGKTTNSDNSKIDVELSADGKSIKISNLLSVLQNDSIREEILEYSMNTDEYADHLLVIIASERVDPNKAEQYQKWIALCKGMYLIAKKRWNIQKDYIDGDQDSIDMSIVLYTAVLERHITVRSEAFLTRVLEIGFLNKYNPTTDPLVLIFYQKNLQDILSDYDLVISAKSLIKCKLFPKSAVGFNPYGESYSHLGFSIFWSLDYSYGLFSAYFINKDGKTAYYRIIYNRLSDDIDEQMNLFIIDIRQRQYKFLQNEIDKIKEQHLKDQDVTEERKEEIRALGDSTYDTIKRLEEFDRQLKNLEEKSDEDLERFVAKNYPKDYNDCVDKMAIRELAASKLKESITDIDNDLNKIKDQIDHIEKTNIQVEHLDAQMDIDAELKSGDNSSD